MIFRLLETPLVDIILIVLAIRFIWPQLFGIRSRKRNHERTATEKNFAREPSQPSSSKYSKEEGKYIDFEEIK
jgi:hypothetical protein